MKRAITTAACAIVTLALWAPAAAAHGIGHVESSSYSGPAIEFWFDSGLGMPGIGPAGGLGISGCSGPCLEAVSRPGELNAHVVVDDASGKPVTAEAWVTYGAMSTPWTRFCGSTDVPIYEPDEVVHVVPAIGVDAHGCNLPTHGTIVATFD